MCVSVCMCVCPIAFRYVCLITSMCVWWCVYASLHVGIFECRMFVPVSQHMHVWLSVCMYVCMGVCVRACRMLCMHATVCIVVHVCVYVCVYGRLGGLMCVCKPVITHVCVYGCMSLCDLWMFACMPVCM